MRNKLLCTILILLISTTYVFTQQEYLNEGFESGLFPDNWSEEFVSGVQEWRFRNGGHNPSDDNWNVAPEQEDIARNPDGAYEGTFNAIFFQQGYDNEKTKLITPALDLQGGTNVELSFFMCQIPWTFAGSTAWDILRVYYRTSETDQWQLVPGGALTDPIYSWEQKKLMLPDVSETYFIAFEGHSRWGYGTCIDEVVIKETGSTPLYIGSIDYFQPPTRMFLRF